MSSPRSTVLPYGPATAWRRLTLGLLVLVLLELLAGHLIFGRLLGQTAALTLDLVLGTLSVLLMVVLASPLWASPRIDHDRAVLVVDLGLLGDVRVPLGVIDGVVAYQPSALEPVDPGAVVVGDDPARATFTRGGSAGFVLIRLTEPVSARFMVLRRAMATEVVLQSADPAAAVAAIQHAVATQRPGAG